MNPLIQISPPIKKLQLKSIGCWDDLTLEFIPGLNIITENGSAVGKSTILRSMVPASCFQTPLFSTTGTDEGRILIEYASRSALYRVPSKQAISKIPPKNLSMCAKILSQLRWYLDITPEYMAILIEDEFAARLDSEAYREAVDLLNGAQCQIVCIISHRLERNDFPDARIYACFSDDDGNARIMLQQSGGQMDES
jgi:hypothetical protein